MAGGTGKIVQQMRTGSVVGWKTVTGHATDETQNGSDVTLVSSMPEAAQWMKLMVTNSSLVGSDTSMLLDILINDVEKIPDIQCGFIYVGGVSGSSRPPRVHGFPIAIPSGASVKARVRTQVDADTVQIAADFYKQASGPAPADAIDTLGVVGTTTKGVLLATGASADVEPLTWTEIEDSTPNAYRALAVSVGGVATMTNRSFALDIGAGSLGTEVELIGDIPFSTDTNEGIGSWSDFGVFPLENELASGSRLVARLKSNAATSVSEITCIVHGIKSI
jgi:hypothetical protein